MTTPDEAASSTPETGTPPPDTASSAPESGVPASNPAESDPFDSEDVQQFDRAYVSKLRAEAAERRKAVKTYEDAFSAYTPEQREGWLSLAAQLASDDTVSQAEAAKILKEVADGILSAGSIVDTPESPAGEADLGEKQFLTEAQLEAKLAEREQKSAIEAEVRKVNEEVSALGYKEGTPEYNDLMWRAVNQHGYDIQKAHEAKQAERQAIIDSYLAEKEGQGGRTVVGGGQAGTPAEGIKNFKDARASVEARIRALSLD